MLVKGNVSEHIIWFSQDCDRNHDVLTMDLQARELST